MRKQVIIIIALLMILTVTEANAQTNTSANDARKFGKWSTPVNLGPPINSTANENSAVLSNDGLTVYFSSDRAGSEDIWFSKRTTLDSNWREPVNLGTVVNSGSMDRLRSISPDGRILLFQSNRSAGSQGASDIWASVRKNVNDDFAWETPINLGTVINTQTDEIAANYLFGTQGNNPKLFFSSSRFGSSDIFMSEVAADGTFSQPVEINELNSNFTEACFWVREDGLEIFFSSTRAFLDYNLDSFDLWSSTRASIFDKWSPPVRLGAPINTKDKRDVGPYLSPDWRKMYFTSNRTGGLGGTDIYLTTRRRLR